MLYFAGTDTDVGKTYVAAAAAAMLHASGVRVGVYKPVASGCTENQGQRFCRDAAELWKAAGRPETIDRVCPQRFLAPLAPPLAAEREHRSVDRRLLADGAAYWVGRCDLLIVEGAGGLFSPLADRLTNADLATQLGAPIVVVAANRLGVIHHVTATCLAARGALAPRSRVVGCVLSHPTAATDPSQTSNAAGLQQVRTPGNQPLPPLLAIVPHGGTFDRPVDWLALAGGCAGDL